ncbi:MAG: DegV family protein [Clostridia bacterium]|nr:DegV family protein [Clostridia bacterium]
MKIIVTTDSTSDLPADIIKKNNIGIMPLIVTLGDKDYYDGVNLTSKDIFDFVNKTGILPKTAARSTVNYQEFFENAMKENNADAIIHFSISNEMSASYANAKSASDELKNVYVIDTRSVSTGAGLLALSCIDKINNGQDLKSILDDIKSEITKVQVSFIISNLKFLHKGGRCSTLSMFGANILMIKPKIKIENGKMVQDKKYMGKYQSVVLKYVKELMNEEKNINKKRVFITTTTINDELNSQVIELLKNAGFEEVILTLTGATVTSHCGENCLGIIFLLN